MKTFLLYLFIFSALGAASYSCKPRDEKPTNDPGARLLFSSDTVRFDTVFTSIGSTSRRLKVKNPQKNALIIQSIQLGGMASSDYEIIINGRAGYFEKDLELRGGDSLFILVKVNINPQNQDLPYLVKDSIKFLTNNNLQKVMLTAYGQDANFIKDLTLPCNTIWDSPKPYVIENFVKISENCSLTIKPGSRVLFSNKAYMQVDGTLLAEGESENLIHFGSDKLGERFRNLPGQWEGIVLGPTSRNNRISFANIKNAFTGLKVTAVYIPPFPTLTLSNSRIENMGNMGLYALNSHVYARNCLFTNAINYSFKGAGGGNYQMEHCTFANFSFLFFRNTPTVGLSNETVEVTGITVSGNLDAAFKNCIIWGDQSDELFIYNNNIRSFSLLAEKSIVKTSNALIDPANNILNIDPLFVNPRLNDLKINAGSPAIDAGNDLGIVDDLEGKPRNSNPDIGAFEFSGQ